MTALSVNVNKIAVLRNSRGGKAPDVIRAARTCITAGCQGITVHPRPDRRHIRPEDVHALSPLCTNGIEFNIEGNAFAPPREGYPGLLVLVREVLPAQCTLVPDGDGQITSDHGFDLTADSPRLRPLIAQLKSFGTRVSLFMDAGAAGIARAAELGADRVELYTGPYAAAFERGDFSRELDACVVSADAARAAGLGVNAGHDLDQANLPALKAAIPYLAEVSIGHALISEALYTGLALTVRAYLEILGR
ncbi:MAG: pyridoxine 5'-phosphate synthase [Proteobacteria bacterium]|jgi:pyridoxine 5-phosphate synthase|nr:pyridoxine 5'-phosphate synthase [Pseudomonadota bacterium]MCE7950269.1 pyridoxine 5'-phosphate synthase [Xanthomonadales bacterium PRO7]HMM56530.1 pyridoxine 5'-phosphate synthase [Rudaea sp.]